MLHVITCSCDNRKVNPPTFDVDAFLAALDAEMQARQCTWKQVADDCGISASKVSLMSRGKHADVNGHAEPSRWRARIRYFATILLYLQYPHKEYNKISRLVKAGLSVYGENGEHILPLTRNPTSRFKVGSQSGVRHRGVSRWACSCANTVCIAGDNGWEGRRGN